MKSMREILDERSERREEAAKAPKKLADIGTVKLYSDRIVFHTEQPAKTIMLSPDTTAHVDTDGEIRRRVTASRLVLMGPFALAAKKKKDARELYLYVEDPAGVAMASIHPALGKQARELTIALANQVIALRAA